MKNPTIPAPSPVYARRSMLFAGVQRRPGDLIEPGLWAALPVAKRDCLLRTGHVCLGWPPPPHRPLVYETSLDRASSA